MVFRLEMQSKLMPWRMVGKFISREQERRMLKQGVQVLSNGDVLAVESVSQVISS